MAPGPSERGPGRLGAWPPRAVADRSDGVTQPATAPADTTARFEVMPLGRSDAEAARLPEPVRLTITCSPRHGPDHSVGFGARMRELGHAVTVHVAARMVRDRGHVDALLAAMSSAGIDDVLLVGGDAAAPLGAYASAVELLPAIAGHPRRPARIGIAGYPEGHPLVRERELERALLQKSGLADYVVTQMCFDPVTLRGWIGRARELGIMLPVLIGVPGQVAVTRLLEMSARIGVGASMAFLRKQRGLVGIVSRSAPDRLYDALAPEIGGPLGVAGFHYFTLNRLAATVEWHRARRRSDATVGPSGPGEASAPNREADGV